MYTVFDVKAGVYGTPFFSMRDELALRMFADIANNPDTMINRHPEDFTLYGVGEFDADNAELIPEKMRALGKASNFIVEQKPIVDSAKAGLTKEDVEYIFNAKMPMRPAPVKTGFFAGLFNGK